MELAGWSVGREPYTAMEEREVTVMRERSVPVIQHTAHTQWRPVERQRLQPIAARREEWRSSEQEEKEQLTVSQSACVRVEEQQQQEDQVEQDGVSIAELDVRVSAVFGRHWSAAGLLVCAVSERGVGSAAGVLAGDVLMSVNGSEVRSVEQLRAQLVGSTGPLLIRVMRHGRRHLTLTATVQR